MVAKSYQSLEQIGEPFVSKGRQYIKVRTKSGAEKTVRWYNETEYLRMYPEDKESLEPTKRIKTEKEVLGFSKGFITIFKGNTYEDKEYFKESKARYARFWGWYFTSEDIIPDDIPEDVEPIKLPWELVGNEDGTLKFESEVTAAVESLVYEPDISEYQGEVGDRIDVILTVERAITLDGFYGPSTMHVFRDYDGNCYVWTTAARSWEVDSEHHIAGTIKEHKLYKGVKQTILSRCRSLDN